MLSALVQLAALGALALSAPQPELSSRDSPAPNQAGDPPFTVSEAELTAAIDCPSSNTAKNTVLLVPGTGEPTVEFYSPNFGELLPANGFNVCFLVVPGLSLGDAQVTSEFVVFGINSLANSTGEPIRVLSHSQGGLNVQWALTFFPSTRQNVASFFAIAPDYRGTIEGPIVDAASELATGGTAMASVLQQSTGSHFLAALAAHGGLNAFAPTTSMRSFTDEVVEPELVDPSSNLASDAVNIAVQEECPARVDDHFLLVTDTITQFFALQAFKSSNGLANPNGTSAADIALLCADVLPVFTSAGGAIEFGDAALTAAITTGVTGTPGSAVTAEPPLMAYAQ